MLTCFSYTESHSLFYHIAASHRTQQYELLPAFVIRCVIDRLCGSSKPANKNNGDALARQHVTAYEHWRESRAADCRELTSAQQRRERRRMRSIFGSILQEEVTEEYASAKKSALSRLRVVLLTSSRQLLGTR